ncbi:MAG: glycosyl hydrolase 108 family protein [Rhizobiaceae bacterium]
MDTIRRDLSELHPAIRDKVQAVLAQLAKEKIPFKVFEAFRLPSRQRFLFNQGRKTAGSIVTFQDAWGSFHQYGLAADFVLFENGGFSWDDKGAKAAWWSRLHEIGAIHGLVPVKFEKPHLQIVELTSQDLREGRFPPGDETWNAAMREAINNWPDGAPPTSILVDKPPLADSIQVENPAGNVLASQKTKDDFPGTIGQSALNAEKISTANFERAQDIIRQFEGGFANDPKDPGGATNFGITHLTLAKWRNVASVTPFEVKQMEYAEAKAIYRSAYWDKNACGSLPGPIGLAVFNIGVHCGTATGATYLQRALNKHGAKLEVDGDIGPATIAAVSMASMRDVLAEMLALYEERLRGHKDFEHFKGGFLNRLNTLRSASTAWMEELPAQGQVVDTSRENHTGAKGMSLDITKLKQLLAELQATIQQLDASSGGAAAPSGDIVVAAPTPVSLPVNDALGKTVGNLLNGKKSAIGIIGGIVASMMSGAQPGSALGDVGGIVNKALPFLEGQSGNLLPLFLGMAAWGGLGKLEKWLAPLGGVIKAPG